MGAGCSAPLVGSVLTASENVLALPESQMRSVRGGRIGMIFQEPGTSLNPVMRVGDQIVEAIEAHTALRGNAARYVQTEIDRPTASRNTPRLRTFRVDGA